MSKLTEQALKELQNRLINETSLSTKKIQDVMKASKSQLQHTEKQAYERGKIRGSADMMSMFLGETEIGVISRAIDNLINIKSEYKKLKLLTNKERNE